jgi:hypothetical protein
MPVCDSQFGGRVTLTIGGQKLAPTEADIKMKTSQVTVDAKANQDGSACYTVKPTLIDLDVTFRRPIGGIGSARTAPSNLELAALGHRTPPFGQLGHKCARVCLEFATREGRGAYCGEFAFERGDLLPYTLDGGRSGLAVEGRGGNCGRQSPKERPD